MNILTNINKKHLLICVIIPLLVGGASALITGDAFKNYQSYQQPPLSPPSWLFPVVWTILYILMGISSYLVYQRKSTLLNKELIIYAVSLFMNFAWPFAFFLFKAYLFSFVWLIALLAVVIVMTVWFYKTSHLAGVLQIPYILWLAFAGYLNLGVYLLN